MTDVSEDDDGRWMADRLAEIDAMAVPPGSFERVLERGRRRQRTHRILAAVAAIAVLAGVGAAASWASRSHPQQVSTAGNPGTVRPTTTSAPTTTTIPERVRVGSTTGVILPYEADVAGITQREYLRDHGYWTTDEVPPDVLDAVLVVNAVPVRDTADGGRDQIAYWAGRLITLTDYPTELRKARERLDEFEGDPGG